MAHLRVVKSYSRESIVENVSFGGISVAKSVKIGTSPFLVLKN